MIVVVDPADDSVLGEMIDSQPQRPDFPPRRWGMLITFLLSVQPTDTERFIQLGQLHVTRAPLRVVNSIHMLTPVLRDPISNWMSIPVITAM